MMTQPRTRRRQVGAERKSMDADAQQGIGAVRQGQQLTREKVGRTPEHAPDPTPHRASNAASAARSRSCPASPAPPSSPPVLSLTPPRRRRMGIDRRSVARGQRQVPRCVGREANASGFGSSRLCRTCDPTALGGGSMPRNSLLAHGVTRNSPKNEDMRKMTYSRGVHFGRFPPSAPQAAKNVT
jgi:hypothetical protein